MSLFLSRKPSTEYLREGDTMVGGSSSHPGVLGWGSCTLRDPGVRAALPPHSGPRAARGTQPHTEVALGVALGAPMEARGLWGSVLTDTESPDPVPRVWRGMSY